jgi:hypothetical protein
MAITMLLGYWSSVKSFLEYQSGATSREAMRISSLLFAPSFPEGAPCDTMKSLGFAISTSDRRISSATITCMETQAKDELWLKEKLATPYNVSIKVTYPATSGVTWIGPADPKSNTEVVKMRRAGTIVDGSTTQLATFDVYVYR